MNDELTKQIEEIKIKYTGDELLGMKISISEAHPEGSMQFFSEKEIIAFNKGIDACAKLIRTREEERDEKVIREFAKYIYMDTGATYSDGSPAQMCSDIGLMYKVQRAEKKYLTRKVDNENKIR